MAGMKVSVQGEVAVVSTVTGEVRMFGITFEQMKVERAAKQNLNNARISQSKDSEEPFGAGFHPKRLLVGNHTMTRRKQASEIPIRPVLAVLGRTEPPELMASFPPARWRGFGRK
jgi:hypothetical protein